MTVIPYSYIHHIVLPNEKWELNAGGWWGSYDLLCLPGVLRGSGRALLPAEWPFMG